MTEIWAAHHVAGAFIIKVVFTAVTHLARFHLDGAPRLLSSRVICCVTMETFAYLLLLPLWQRRDGDKLEANIADRFSSSMGSRNPRSYSVKVVSGEQMQDFQSFSRCPLTEERTKMLRSADLTSITAMLLLDLVQPSQQRVDLGLDLGQLLLDCEKLVCLYCTNSKDGWWSSKTLKGEFQLDPLNKW